MSVVLGINTFHPGASAALVVNGVPVAAIAEERLNRKKYYAGFPALAIRHCLEMGHMTLGDIDAVAIGNDSSANVAEKVQFALRHPTRLLNFAKMRLRRRPMDDLRTLILDRCGFEAAKARFSTHHVEHHVAHIASAYFIAPWERAAGFSVDGSGDFVTAMLAECVGDDIVVKHRVFLPHSLGNVYFMICQFIGYGKYGDEGKVMGLAPYGKDPMPEIFDRILELTPDGVQLGEDFFAPVGADGGLTVDSEGEMVMSRQFTDHLVRLVGPPRNPENEITQRDMDLAFGVQQAFERGYMHLLKQLHERVPLDRVCISGGCALNSVANGKVFEETPFRHTCIQPAAGDEGLALGAALYVARSVMHDGARFEMKHSYLGPEFTEGEIRAGLDAAGIQYTRLEKNALIDAVTDRIVAGDVVGWFQGGMEWGPRALGNRSILVHPGLPNMKDVLNARIKRREWFRPFAPSVLRERQAEIFERSEPSPFMLHVYKIRPEWRERLCAVTHVDGTGRLQTVAHDENPLYHDLISAFGRKTGIPVVLNTSFNENEPVVCRPAEAIDCYVRTRMDVLAIGPFLCRKGAEGSAGATREG